MKLYEPPPYDSIMDYMKSISSKEFKRLSSQKAVEESIKKAEKVEKSNKPDSSEKRVEAPQIKDHDVDLLT